MKSTMELTWQKFPRRQGCHTIRDMIKENRFELVESKGGYLRCEICGENIRSGRLCPKCEAAYHRQIEDEARQQRKNYKQMSGFSGERPEGESGRRRFER